MGAVDVEPPRVEIELTSDERGRRRGWRRGTTGATAASSAMAGVVDAARTTGGGDATGEVPPGAPDAVGTTGEPAVLGGERNRLVVTAVAVAVVALALGWMLGRSTGGGGSDAVAGEASTPATEPETATTLLPGEELPGVDLPEPATTPAPPTTRGPGMFTTTTVPVVVEERVAVPAPVAGQPYEVVVVGERSVGVLDLRSGMSRTRDARFSGGGLESASIGDDWVGLLTPDGSSVSIRFDDGREARIPGDGWQTAWVPGTDRFWSVADDGFLGRRLTFTEYTAEGDATGASLEIESSLTWPVLGDPQGGVILQIAGKTYAVSPDGSSLIGTGTLFGITAESALFHDCDAELRCGLVVVDRATGETTEVPELDLGADAIVESPYFWFGGRTALAPSGDAVVLLAIEGIGEPTWVVADLTTGGTWPLSEGVGFSGPLSPAWSPDGRFAFHVTRGELRAFDRATEETIVVADGYPPYAAVGIRPFSVGADE